MARNTWKKGACNCEGYACPSTALRRRHLHAARSLLGGGTARLLTAGGSKRGGKGSAHNENPSRSLSLAGKGGGRSRISRTSRVRHQIIGAIAHTGRLRRHHKGRKAWGGKIGWRLLRGGLNALKRKGRAALWTLVRGALFREEQEKIKRGGLHSSAR